MVGLLSSLDNTPPEDGGLSPLKQALLAAGQMFAQASAQGARTGQGITAGLGAGGQAYQGAIEGKRKAKREKAKDDAEQALIAEKMAEIERTKAQAAQLMQFLGPVDTGAATGGILGMSPQERALYLAMDPGDATKAILDRMRPETPRVVNLTKGDQIVPSTYNQQTRQWDAIPGAGGARFNPNSYADNARAGIPAGMERKPDGSLGWMPGFLEAQGAAQDQKLSKKTYLFPDGTPYRIHLETGAQIPLGAGAAGIAEDGSSGPPAPTSEPFDYGEGGGVLSVLSDVVNRSAGQFVDLGDRDVEKARAKLGMLRVVLPSALRDSARPLKMSEKHMQDLLGGDVLESSSNRIAKFNQVRESLTAEYKDNQQLISDVRVTKDKKADLVMKQKRIAEVLNLIGPPPAQSSGNSPEDESLMNKYLE